jgi:mRNA-decapping enzyme subunit 2
MRNSSFEEDVPLAPVFNLTIQAIEWVRLTELPTWTGKRPKKTNSKDKKFYNVTPFVG